MVPLRWKGRMIGGNGRTGRLLLNWQLLQARFPLTVIQVEERARYLGALDQGHAGQLLDLKPWSRARSSAAWIWRQVGNDAVSGRA